MGRAKTTKRKPAKDIPRKKAKKKRSLHDMSATERAAMAKKLRAKGGL